jgi:hypothetical protein
VLRRVVEQRDRRRRIFGASLLTQAQRYAASMILPECLVAKSTTDEEAMTAGGSTSSKHL